MELSSMTCLYIVVVEADQSDDLLGLDRLDFISPSFKVVLAMHD